MKYYCIHLNFSIKCCWLSSCQWIRRCT